MNMLGDRAQSGQDTVFKLGFRAAPWPALQEEKLSSHAMPQRMKAAGSSWDRLSPHNHRGSPG